MEIAAFVDEPLGTVAYVARSYAEQLIGVPLPVTAALVAYSPGADSAEALKELRERSLRPSLIIADYRLVDGKTGVRETKQMWDVLGRMPAIVITGDTGEDTLREIETAGCALLHKPVDPYELQRRTHQMIADGEVA